MSEDQHGCSVAATYAVLPIDVVSDRHEEEDSKGNQDEASVASKSIVSVSPFAAAPLVLFFASVVLLAYFTTLVFVSAKEMSRVCNLPPFFSSDIVNDMKQYPIPFDSSVLSLLSSSSSSSASSSFSSFSSSPPSKLQPPSIGPEQLRLNNNRLVFVLVDGMRYSITQKMSSPLREVLAVRYANDSRLLKLRAEIPTISIPNYLAIITGAAPEITGELGNTGRMHEDYIRSSFETVFDVAARYNMTYSFSGDTGGVKFWADHLSVMKEHVGGLNDQWVNVHRNNYSDPARIAQCVVTGADISFYYHEDLDYTGHHDVHGIHGAAYQEAELRTANVIQAIADALDEKTTLVVVADHGMLSSGGHGGLELHLREVPLLVYRKNSNLGLGPAVSSSAVEFPPSQAEHFHLVDMAPTLSGLLGIPVPRQSHGSFIDPVMIYANLTAAKAQVMHAFLCAELKQYISSFMEEADLEAAGRLMIPSSALDDKADPGTILVSLSNYAAELLQIYSHARKHVTHKHTPIIVLAFALGFIALCILCLFVGFTFRQLQLQDTCCKSSSAGLSKLQSASQYSTQSASDTISSNHHASPNADHPNVDIELQELPRVQSRLLGSIPSTDEQHQDAVSAAPSLVSLARLKSFCLKRTCPQISVSFKTAFTLCIFYYGTVSSLWVILFDSLWSVDRQFVWNSSQLDTPEAMDHATIMACIGLPVVVLGGFSLRKRTKRHSLVWCFWTLIKQEWTVISESDEVRFAVSYSLWLLWCVGVCCIVLCVASSAGRVFFVEGWWDEPLIQPSSWELRFITSDLMLMSAPLVVCTLLDGGVAVMLVLVSFGVHCRAQRQLAHGKNVLTQDLHQQHGLQNDQNEVLVSSITDSVPTSPSVPIGFDLEETESPSPSDRAADNFS